MDRAEADLTNHTEHTEDREERPDGVTRTGPEGSGKGLSRRDFLKAGGAGAAGAALLLASPGEAIAADSGYIEYNEHGANHFSEANKRSVEVRGDTLRLSDPMKSGDRYVGWLTSRAVRTGIYYDTLIPSWQARTPPGTRLTVTIRVRYGGRWSEWMSLGSYSATGWSASASPTKKNWRADVDTIRSRNGQRAGAYQYHLRLVSDRRDRTPIVRGVSLVASQASRHGDRINVGNLKRVWGKSINVPRRSQYDYDAGAAWCSPTSLSMVMAYWGERYDRNGWKRSVPETARGVYDTGAEIWGNWPFSTGYAGHLSLRSRVSRFNSIQQVERWIDAGIPVIVSLAWDNRYRYRRLNNASIYRATYGHLLVVVGFTRSGDVVVNDPAASPRSQVRRVYDRGQFSRAWLNSDRWRGGRSDGVVYLVHPQNQDTPYSWASRGSW